jgi:predicted O-methyltransferase YrrM
MELIDLEYQSLDRLPVTTARLFREARILQIAVRLKLFTALNKQAQNAFQLAKRLQTDLEMTERLLIALTTLDLVRHHDGYWRNCLSASLYLVEGKPLYQGEAIELAAEVWDRYHNLEQMIRQGVKEPAFSMKLNAPWQTIYLKAMQAIAVAGQAQRLSRLLPISGRRALLDIGGAPGTYSLALCERFPALKATLLEHPDILAQSKSIIEQFDSASRIIFKEGDWRKQKFGCHEYDALLLTHVLVKSEAEALKQLSKAYEALKAQGLLIVQSFLLHNDLNGGKAAALANLLENQFTTEQMRRLISEAGFERISFVLREPTKDDILIAYKPTDSKAEQDRVLEALIRPEIELFSLVPVGEEESTNGKTLLPMPRRVVVTN